MMTAVNNDTSKSPSSDHSSQPCTSSLLDFFISNQFCDAQICLVNTSFDGTSRASSLRLNSTTNTVVDQREEDSSSTFSIHRIILASASPVFQIIFNNQSPNRERRLEDRDHQVKTLLPSFTLQGTRGSFNNSNNSTPPILPIYYLDGVKSRDGFYHCLTQIYSSGSAPLTPLNAFSTRAVACRLELMDFVGDIDTFLFKIWENQQLMKEGNPESDSRNSVWLQWAMAAIDDEAPTALLEKLISCATAASETPTLTSSSGSVFQYTKFKFISAVIAEYNKKLTLMSESSASMLYSLVTFTDFSIEQIEEVYSCNTIPASLLSKLLMENLKSRAINNSSNIFLINSNNNNDTACTSNQVDDESFEDAPTITERDIRAAANTDAAGNDLLETSFYDTPGQINSFLQDADILLENLDQVLSITSRTSSLVPSDQQQEEHRKSMQPPPNSLPIIHPSTTIDRSFTESPESIPDSPSLSETPKPKFLTVMEAVEPTPPPPAAALLTKPEPAWKKIAARLSEEQIKSKIGPENTSDAASAAMNSSLSRNPGLKQSSRPTWLFNLWKIDETEEEVVEQEEDMDNRILILPTELDLSKSSFISPIVASPSKPIVVPPPKKQNTVHLKESISNENIKQQQSQQLIQHHQKLQSGLSHLQPVLLKQKGNSMPLSPGRLSTPELLQNVQKKLVKLALLDHDDDVDFSVPTPTSRQLISAPQLGLSFAPAAEVPAETTINNIINNNSKNNDSIKRTNILEDSYTSDMSFPTSFQSANDLLNRIQTTRNKFINYKSDAAKRQSSSSSSSTFYGKRLPEVKNQVLVEDESSPLINATTVGDEDQPSLNYTITSLDPSRILDHADIVERTLTAVIAAPTSVNNNTTTSTITSMSRSSIGLKHKGGARPPPFELYSSSKSSSSSFLRNVNDEDKSHRRSFDTSFYLNTSGSSSNGSGGTNTRSFWKSARIKSMAVKGFKASSADSAHHEGRRSLDIL